MHKQKRRRHKTAENNKPSISSTDKIKKTSNKEKKSENKKDDSFTNPDNIGRTIKSNKMDYEIKKAGEIENEFSTDPFKIKITGLSAEIMTPKSEEAKFYLQGKENTPAIIIYTTVENTEDKKANLYLNQSQITTDTKEQLEPDFLLSQGMENFY